MSSHVVGLKLVFGNISDPNQLFEAHTHVQALRMLLDPAQETRNIRVLIGDTGTGKTLLLHSLLREVQSSTLSIRLFWTQLQIREFLCYFLQELGVSRPARDLAEAKKQFAAVLKQSFSRGREVFVLIDEAHALRDSVLRGIAELLDCPLARSKHLRVVLAGLPSLEATLSSPALQQLSSRILTVASLTRLTPEESGSYIRRRLELFGWRSDEVFTEDAIALIADLAEGIPGRINNVCFELIYWAEQRGCSRIDTATALECAADEGWLRKQFHTAEVLSKDVARRCEPRHEQKLDPASARVLDVTELKQLELQVDNSREPTSKCTLTTNEAPEALSTSIGEWFGYERLAWSGTTGELAASLQQPEAVLLQSLSLISGTLRNVGVELTIIQLPGCAAFIRLRAIPGRIRPEDASAELAPTVSEPKLVEDGEPGKCLAANDSHQLELTDEVIADAPYDSSQNERSSVCDSAVMLGLSNSARIMETLGTFAFAFHLRWTIVPVLLVIVPLVFLGRDRLLRQLLLGAQSVQQIALTQSHNAGVSAEQHKTVTRNHETNLTESAGEGNQEQKPQPESVLGLLQAARSGDPNAQFQLGTAYLRGRGLPPDTVTAYTWLTVAFANGNKQAESLIRELTRTLNSTEIACIRWNLGEMYAGGIGVRPDKVTAYMWHLLAEFSGESRSRVALSELDRSMTADEKSEAKSRASEWLRKHRLHQHATLPAT